ncbi:MAG: pantoate--beta-alanine ligase [Cypionkella sp.]|nr:pantoate--beta-alanine ligase [Cypionkella sp.]
MTTVLRSVADLRAQVDGWHKAGDVVGLVPTMGALHAGHLSLLRAAQTDCARVIVTIFVNPKQFNNSVDLAKYPRTEAADLALLRGAGVDVLFAPPPEEVYPAGFATTVSVGGVAGPLEGAARPGHFDGVATVVTKLFGMSRADRAYFGQKDWQQLQVVRRMVSDLNLPISIIGCETLREADGLAMSSRNTRLSPAARAQAPALYAAMTRAAAALRAGQSDALDICAAEVLAAGFDSIDYIDLRDSATLEPIPTAGSSPARLLAAAWIDAVRLIDNIPV